MTATAKGGDSAPAVVLNMYSTGLGIARNLARHGVSVFGVSSRPSAFGHYSRYCRGLMGPDSQDEPEALAAFLADLGKSLGSRGIVFPTRDADVRFLDRFRPALEEFFMIPQVRDDQLDLILNKARLAQRAHTLNIPVPVTVPVSSESEIEENRERIVFPSVLKPVYAYSWRRPEVWEAVGRRKGIKVRSLDELMAAYSRVSAHERRALVQEWIPGEEDQFFIFGGYFDRASRCLADFTLQKLFQYPPEFGLGCLMSAVPNEEVRDLSLRLLQSIDFTGIAEVEFKRDRRTGAYALIEVNPRHWDQHTLGTVLGVNLSYVAYKDLCGDGAIPARQPRTGRAYWIWGAGLFGCMKEDLRHGRFDWRKVAPLLAFRPKAYAVWSWRDPAPSWKLLTYRRST